MAWLQLETDLGSREPNTIELLLEELGAVAITLKDGGDNPLLEPAPGETPIWPTVILTALFPADTSEPDLVSALRNHCNPDSLHFNRIEDQDWQARFEHELKPKRFGRRLWITPNSSQSLPNDGIAVTLSPGLAFGSGEHPTTAMCLKWLDGLRLKGARVLDYGCGSGILGLAAAALGAKSVCMTDIDPQALISATDNAGQNGLQDRVDIVSADKIEDSVRYDILLANILSGTLIELGPNLDRLMRPGARMAITGILADQADKVCAAWSSWAEMTVAEQIDGWVLLTGSKNMKEGSKY